MKGKTLGMVFALVAVFTFGCPPIVSACSPMFWTFEQASEGAKAIVYGKVVKAKDGGRRATVDVKSYVGPGEAPKRVVLPGTVDSRGGNDECPDFSMRFKEGKEYVFFLADIPPRLELAYPKWITAYPVAEGRVTINSRGEKDALDVRLMQFAELRHFPVRQPSPDSPVWRQANGTWLPVLIALSAVGSVSALIGYVMTRRKRI